MREPDRPKENFAVPETTKESVLLSPMLVFPSTIKEPETTVVPPKTDLSVLDPETKKVTSVPGNGGKTGPGSLAKITLPVMPMWDLSATDPDMLFVTKDKVGLLFLS